MEFCAQRKATKEDVFSRFHTGMIRASIRIVLSKVRYIGLEKFRDKNKNNDIIIITILMLIKFVFKCYILPT